MIITLIMSLFKAIEDWKLKHSHYIYKWLDWHKSNFSTSTPQFNFVKIVSFAQSIGTSKGRESADERLTLQKVVWKEGDNG